MARALALFYRAPTLVNCHCDDTLPSNAVKGLKCEMDVVRMQDYPESNYFEGTHCSPEGTLQPAPFGHGCRCKPEYAPPLCISKIDACRYMQYQKGVCPSPRECITNLTDISYRYDRAYPAEKASVPATNVCPSFVDVPSPFSHNRITPTNCVSQIEPKNGGVMYPCNMPKECFGQEWGCNQLSDGVIGNATFGENGTCATEFTTGSADTNKYRCQSMFHSCNGFTTIPGACSGIKYDPDHYKLHFTFNTTYYVTSIIIYNRVDCCQGRATDIRIESANPIPFTDAVSGAESPSINLNNLCYAHVLLGEPGVGLNFSQLTLYQPKEPINWAEVVFYGYTGARRNDTDTFTSYVNLQQPSCQCPEGTVEPYCHEVDKCSDFCMHGNCSGQICLCHSGYRGIYCDQKTTPPCINGIEVYLKDNVPVCICDVGFRGEGCDQEIKTPVVEDGEYHCDYRYPLCKIWCRSCPSGDDRPSTNHDLHECPYSWPFSYFCGAYDTRPYDGCHLYFPFSAFCFRYNDPMDPLVNRNTNFEYTLTG